MQSPAQAAHLPIGNQSICLHFEVKSAVCLLAAASNLLMPPMAGTSGHSSHSSQEDCSGVSFAVKHKLQEHLMQKHRRECPGGNY